MLVPAGHPVENVCQAAVNTNHFADVTVELGPIKVWSFWCGLRVEEFWKNDHQLRLGNIPSFAGFFMHSRWFVWGISEPSTVPWIEWGLFSARFAVRIVIQMTKGWLFSLLNDKQMSNQVGMEVGTGDVQVVRRSLIYQCMVHYIYHQQKNHIHIIIPWFIWTSCIYTSLSHLYIIYIHMHGNYAFLKKRHDVGHSFGHPTCTHCGPLVYLTRSSRQKWIV